MKAATGIGFPELRLEEGSSESHPVLAFEGIEEYPGSAANRNGSEFVTTDPIIGYIYSF